MTLPRILVVDDQFARNATERSLFLQNAGLVEEGSNSGEMQQALAEVTFCSGQSREGNRMINDPQVVIKAAGGKWALVLLDVQFDSGELDSVGRPAGQAGDDTFGLTVYRHLKTVLPNLPVILLSGKRQEEIAEDKVSVPYLSKLGLTPYEMRRALASHGLLDASGTHAVLDLGVDIIADAPATLAAFRQGFVHAGSDASILILGESGVGKEVLARYIHRVSLRSQGPFVAVNVAAIPRDLVESELFGIGRNVATSVAGRAGKFELASGGTLFLDEIGDMPLETQAKVLRALQERRVVRVGEADETKVDIRLVCATSQDLGKLMEANGFRGDLLYRINTVPITIPPLRERRQDIAPLCRRVLMNCGARQGKAGLSLSAHALFLLESQSFLGNVRELANLIERLASAAGQHHVIGKPAVLEALTPGTGTLVQAQSDVVHSSQTVHGPPNAVGSIGTLIDAIEGFSVDLGTQDLLAAKSHLDAAYYRLLQRLAGAVLERCRDPVSRSFNRQKAMQLLTGDTELRGKGPSRVINQILGRRLEEKVLEKDLELLVQQWRGHNL